MFRTLLLSTRRLLVPRPMNGVSLMIEAPPAESTTIYDVRRNELHARNDVLSPLSRRVRPSLITGEDYLMYGKHVRWTSSGQKNFEMPNPTVILCTLTSMLKCVDLNDLKDVPPAAFWTGIGLGSSQLVIPLLEILAGYSPVLTMYQLYSAAMAVAFVGGVKLSRTISDKSPNWDTIRFSAVPASIALVGLLMPYPIGFLMVGSSVLTALYLDLKACLFPPWACSLLVFLYLTTAVGLLLALSAYVLFHNNENKTKKKKRVTYDEKRATNDDKRPIEESKEDDDDDDDGEVKDARKEINK